ncbi:hypothetical protein D3C85_1392700 [compost metagenome]
MGRLVQQAGILPLLVGLPGLQLIEQGVEILPQLVQLGDIGRRNPLIEGSPATDAVGDLRQRLEGGSDGILHPARHIEGAQYAEQQADQGRQQGLQQEAQQVLAVADKVNTGYLRALAHHGQLHRPRQEQPCQVLPQIGPGAGDVTAPARQHLTARQ